MRLFHNYVKINYHKILKLFGNLNSSIMNFLGGKRMSQGTGKHYRVAKRSVEQEKQATEGFYIAQEKKPKFIIAFALLGVIFFFNGLLLGLNIKE